jgi:hypothetical protein
VSKLNKIYGKRSQKSRRKKPAKSPLVYNAKKPQDMRKGAILS